MYLVAIGWLYVVMMMSVAEATGSQGTVLGAVITFALYGLLPLSIVMYVMGTPARRSQRARAEAQAEAANASAAASTAVEAPPDGGGHPAGDAVAPKREEA